MVSSRLPTPLSFPRGVELCRNPATGGESSCHHLAARLVGIVCCRTSSAPNKKMKSFDSLVATVLLILNGHSGSSPSPCHHHHYHHHHHHHHQHAIWPASSFLYAAAWAPASSHPHLSSVSDAASGARLGCTESMQKGYERNQIGK